MTFFTLICCKNCFVCLKRLKINKKRPGLTQFIKQIHSSFFLKNGPFPAAFSFLLSFQYTVDIKQMFNVFVIFCQWLDLHCGPLVLEATALPTEPNHYPNSCFVLVWRFFGCNFVRDVFFFNQHPLLPTNLLSFFSRHSSGK